MAPGASFRRRSRPPPRPLDMQIVGMACIAAGGAIFSVSALRFATPLIYTQQEVPLWGLWMLPLLPLSVSMTMFGIELLRVRAVAWVWLWAGFASQCLAYAISPSPPYYLDIPTWIVILGIGWSCVGVVYLKRLRVRAVLNNRETTLPTGVQVAGALTMLSSPSLLEGMKLGVLGFASTLYPLSNFADALPLVDRRALFLVCHLVVVVVGLNLWRIRDWARKVAILVSIFASLVSFGKLLQESWHSYHNWIQLQTNQITLISPLFDYEALAQGVVCLCYIYVIYYLLRPSTRRYFMTGTTTANEFSDDADPPHPCA